MISAFNFGWTADGREVVRYRLTGINGAYVDVLNYGGVIQSLAVPDRRGNLVNVVLGFSTVADYEADEAYIGALVGRWAGRISGAAFELNGVRYPLAANDGPNHLHGGLKGFNRYVWDDVIDKDSLVLSRLSPDGEEGYPGVLAVKVKYSFDYRNHLTLEYEAVSDDDTVVNLTNHTYFNLGGAGSGDVLDHQLTISADRVVELDATLIPTGHLLEVAGTPFDFRAARRLGRNIDGSNPQLDRGGGYDHYFELTRKAPGRPLAQAFSPETGITLELFTTEPGLQFYTANNLKKISKRKRLRARIRLLPGNSILARRGESTGLPGGDPEKRESLSTDYPIRVWSGLTAASNIYICLNHMMGNCGLKNINIFQIRRDAGSRSLLGGRFYWVSPAADLALSCCRRL